MLTIIVSVAVPVLSFIVSVIVARYNIKKTKKEIEHLEKIQQTKVDVYKPTKNYFYPFMKESIDNLKYILCVIEDKGKRNLLHDLGTSKYEIFMECLMADDEKLEKEEIKYEDANTFDNHLNIYLFAEKEWQETFKKNAKANGLTDDAIENVLDVFQQWHKPHIEFLREGLKLFSSVATMDDQTKHEALKIVWRQGFELTNQALIDTGNKINGRLTGLVYKGTLIGGHTCI